MGIERRRAKESTIRLMIVEDDPGVGYAVSRWLDGQNVRSVLATTTHEAMDLLRDVVFIEAAFDGLLVDYHIGDDTSIKVIQEFRDEFPSVPVALMTGSQDESLEMWLNEKQIPLFRKPLQMVELKTWLDGIKRTA